MTKGSKIRETHLYSKSGAVSPSVKFLISLKFLSKTEQVTSFDIPEMVNSLKFMLKGGTE